MLSPNHFISLLLFCLVILCFPKESSTVTPCLYDINEKGVIDITSIGRVDGTPKWKNQNPQITDQHVYSYNPCKPFSQSSCDNVAACQTFATDEKLAYSLGTQNSAQWRKVTGQEYPILYYTSGDRHLEVELKCAKSGDHKLDVYGHDNVSSNFKMTLTSKCVCWDVCKGGVEPGSQHDGGLSTGTIFIITLVAIVFVYLLVFMAYNRIKKQATGIDILPHRQFWTELPVHSLNGVTFIYRKVTGKKSNYNTVE